MDVIEARRRLLIQNFELPAQYKRIMYLESTGSQYIDTLLVIPENFRITCSYMPTEMISQEQAIFSIWTSKYNYWNCFIYQNTTKIDVYANGHNYCGTCEIGNKKFLSLERNNNNWTIKNGESETIFNHKPGQASNPTTLKIFIRGDTQGSNTHIKLYFLTVFVENALVGNFVPCVRKSDNKPGMYDTVSKTFFTNAGTDEFIIPE